MKVMFEALGCKLNQAEIEQMAVDFSVAGHHVVSGVKEADAYILNTCTVTRTADSKTRQLLRKAHRQNPDAVIIATGCYAERAPDELTGIDGVHIVLGNDKKAVLSSMLDKYEVNPSSPSKITAGELIPGRTRSFIKVQEGCSNFCSYCIVPFVRGREKSLSADVVINEIKRRVESGHKEIVLTGTRIGAYNHGGIRLKDLMKLVLDETDVLRLRISSLQPQEITADLLELWSDGRVCPHFHMSLQSGSDSVLRRMGRHYDIRRYSEALSLIRSLVPDVAITTDVIVGFPDETEEEFEESYEFCRRMEFARIHVFGYSPRPGTRAAAIGDTVDDREKKRHSQRMLALAEDSALKFRQKFTGKILPVLWEARSKGGVWSGLTGNYIKVLTNSDEDLTNRLKPVKVY